ncbi:HET-domain-containing protein [Tothia fuscella]|uniref:HET-domain-containing protein n=1 Tax=Tothia fuscella TaxID=1048955 RepID=A0A9P4NKU2_9PEZI|nr:HET-domain-containing protein [Tothia fuscella]
MESSFAALEDPKNQIRLFQILPDTFEDGSTIKGRHQVFSIDKCPPYTAISYEWGNGTPFHEISVEEANLQIGDNLWHFLKACLQHAPQVVETLFRPPFTTKEQISEALKWLWIDQICIDQSNIGERNAQVELMTKIYSHSFMVIAWLGNDPAMVDAVNYIEKSWMRGTYPTQCQAVLHASYWRRVWMQQELLLSSKLLLMSGASMTTWGHMLSGLPGYETLTGQADRSLLSLMDLMFDTSVLAKTPARNLELPAALNRFSPLHCSDPRDRVFGIMSLVKPSDRCKIDYGLSVDEVYRRALLKCVELGYIWEGPRTVWRIENSSRKSERYQYEVFYVADHEETSFESRNFWVVGFETEIEELKGKKWERPNVEGEIEC